jgi:hypothetical protein
MSKTDVLKHAMKLPGELAWTSFGLAKALGGYSLRTVVGLVPRKQRPIAVDRHIHHPLDDALAAVEAIHEGQTEQDKAVLVDLGKATLIKTIIRAEEDLAVPNSITAAVVGVAVNEGLDPHAVKLVSPEDAERANNIVQDYLPDKA